MPHTEQVMTRGGAGCAAGPAAQLVPCLDIIKNSDAAAKGFVAEKSKDVKQAFL